MKINAGCGKRVLGGWVNVDIAPINDRVTQCDLKSMPFQPGAADTIMAIHVIEHIHLWEVPTVLRQFHRVMRDGGTLILEQPDIAKCCRNLIDGQADQQAMWGIYGEQKPMTDPVAQRAQVHKWGWTFETLKPLVVAAGFVRVVECRTQYHPIGRDNRDFRLEARKDAPGL